MAVAHQERKRATRPLVEGHRMRCPRCKQLHDVLEYQPFEQIQEYKHETVPILKCPSCRWIFAVAPTVLEAVGA